MDDKVKKIFFTTKILEWGRENRREFVWRSKNDDFFVVFISEFFLRKTRSENVEKFLVFFLNKYHSFCDIANIPLDILMEEIKPLGLHNQRAKALKEIAGKLCGQEQPSYEEIMKLPHCGRYTASAIECFYRKKRHPIVDNNIQRLFNRFFSCPKFSEIHKAEPLWNLAQELLPETNYVEYNYYLLDFAALVCKPVHPRCGQCPLAPLCDFYHKKGSK